MDNSIITGLVCNASLWLVLSIIYNNFFTQNSIAKWKLPFAGLIIGFVGIILMLTPVEFTPGIFFDTRSILISVTAMFFGAIPTIIAVMMICICRIIIGGAGVMMGVLVTISTAAIGLLWHHFRLKNSVNKHSILIEFYVVGLMAHLAMLLCMLALPKNMIQPVFGQMWFVVLILYPIGSVLLSAILFNGLKINQTRQALMDSENKYKALYYEDQKKQTLLKVLNDSVPDLIFYKNTNSVYIGCNIAFANSVGKKETEVIGCTDMDLYSEEEAEKFRASDKELLKQCEIMRYEELVAYPDGKQVYFDTMKTPYFNADGAALGLIGISRDITERKRKEEEILFLTHHDGLTGLYNRTFFDEEIMRLDTQQYLPLSVIIGDINGLKLINDALGHSEGDKLLIEVSRILISCVRPQDITARMGGDEFGILLPNTDMHTVQSIVKKIQKACEQYVTQSNKETYYASIALGYDTKINPEESFRKIIKSADEFLYRKKLLEYKSLHSSIVSSIKTTMYEKSHETEEHTERMAGLSNHLGKVLGLSEKDIDKLELLSMLHDIGKIGVEDSILTKCGKLTDEEWREMKKHPEIGYRIALAAPELKHVAEFILCHHERWDGKGYPQGLAGEEIPILSRIISVVDSYDAMTNDRVYRKAISNEQAKTEIMDNAGVQFDPQIAKIFVEQVLA